MWGGRALAGSRSEGALGVAFSGRLLPQLSGLVRDVSSLKIKDGESRRLPCRFSSVSTSLNLLGELPLAASARAFLFTFCSPSEERLKALESVFLVL